MKTLLLVVVGVAIGLLAKASPDDTRDLQPTTKVLPEVVADQRYTNVTVVRRSGDWMSIMHDSGVANVRVRSLTDKSLDLIFPGLLALRAEKAAAEKRAEEEELRWRQEEHRLLKVRVEAALAQVPRSAQPDVTEKESLVCVLVSGRDTYYVGETPSLSVHLINRSSKQIRLIRALEGSEHGRFPRCSYETTDPLGKPVWPRNSFCGNKNDLTAGDFISVDPGRSVAPEDVRTRLSYPFTAGAVSPGMYRVQFHYSTRSVNSDDYRGGPYLGGPNRPFPDGGEIQKKFDGITHVDVRSNELKITFIPKSE